MSGRLYSDAEVGDLIRVASERQEDARTSFERGIPLQEIERIASEIGVDPAQVRAAALDLDYRKEAGLTGRLLGGPFEIGQKRFVEGVATIRQWEEVVPELRRVLGGTGRIDQLGHTWEWTRQVKDLNLVLSETQVRVRTVENQTMIEARTRYGAGASIAYLMGLVLSLTVAGAFLDGAGQSDLVNTVALGASSAGGLAAARASIGAWSRRQREKLKQVMNRLDEAISHTTTAADFTPEPRSEPTSSSD